MKKDYCKDFIIFLCVVGLVGCLRVVLRAQACQRAALQQNAQNNKLYWL